MRRHCPTCTCQTQATLIESWQLAQPIAEALTKTRFADLRNDAKWWQAQFRARNGLRFPEELAKAEAWCASNPERAPKRAYRRFLNGWFERAS